MSRFHPRAYNTSMPEQSRPQFPSKDDFDKICAGYHKACDAICATLSSTSTNGPLQQTLIAFQQRMLHGITTLRYLDRVPDSRRDSAVVLRALYDLHLQILYILCDAVKRVDDYRAYMAVEQFEWVQLIKTSNAALAQRIRARADFAPAAAEREADYNKIKHRFLAKSGEKCWPHWYKGKLDDLAKEVGRLDEYKLVQKILSQIVHGSAIAIARPLMIPDPAFVHDGWIITTRVLDAIAKYLNVTVEDEHLPFIEQARTSIY